MYYFESSTNVTVFDKKFYLLKKNWKILIYSNQVKEFHMQRYLTSKVFFLMNYLLN